jgi:L-aspartate oxidase
MSTPGLARRLLAPSPGWTTSADVIVVGSGIAGLTAALRLRRRVDRVLLVTKTVLDSGSTRWAQGGIAAALDPADSPSEHLQDTLVAGAGVCDVDAVRVLVTEGPERVRELVALGTQFDRTPAGEIALTREGGHHRDRIAHAGGDATGREISRSLLAALEAVRHDPGIEVVEHAMVVDLLQTADGRVCGVTLHVLGEGQRDGVGAALARAVVLATGGLGQVYSSTTNPPVATGDGVAAALRAGADVRDLEFVQFHPTVLWLGAGSSGQQPLISEAVRGEGAFLVDRSGDRFMVGVHELADLAPRDVVARAIVARMHSTGTDHVYLDARHLGQEFLERRFPSIVQRCRELGFDPATERLPVAPAQHYASGGVVTDLRGRSSLPGLSACGEVACSGVHGANRLASNSLLEGLVFAHRIADDLTQRLADGELPFADPVDVAGEPGLLDPAARVDVQAAMTAGSGAVRSAESTSRTAALLADIAALSIDVPSAAAWETTNLHQVAGVLTTLASRREESRGGHVRSDFPAPDDVRWRGHQTVRLEDDGRLSVTYAPAGAGETTHVSEGVRP